MTWRRTLALGLTLVAVAPPLLAQQSDQRTKPAMDVAPTSSDRAPTGINRWSGWYVGGNAGAIWSRFDVNGFTADVEQVSGVQIPQRGIVIVPGTTRPIPAARTNWAGVLGGGVNLGYNHPTSTDQLWGLEADFDAGSRNDSTSYGALIPSTAITSPTILHLHRTLHSSWTGSLRARYGEMWHNSLVYATAGVATAHVTMTALDSTFAGPTPEVAVKLPNFTVPAAQFGRSDTKTHVGFTVGGGAERELTPTISLAVEYRYTNFGNKSYNVAFDANAAANTAVRGNPAVLPEPTAVRLTSTQVTARLNFLLP